MTVQVSIRLHCSAERSSFTGATLYESVQVPAVYSGGLARGCALPDVLCPMQWEHPLRAEYSR